MLLESDAAELRRLDLAHHLPSFQNYKMIGDLGGSRIITRGQGSTIYDIDGHALLDGMAGLWCVQVGYGRSELADAAREQMLELPFYNNFFRTATAPGIRLAAKIASLLGNGLDHVMFNNSGSESNDTVLRLVRYYWSLKGQPRRKNVIARWNSYHGSTVAGTSLGGMEYMHVQGDLPIPGISHIIQPYHFGDAPQEDAELFGLRAAQALEDRILELGADTVAAFIAEPVQGAGGVIIPPASYWPRIEQICRRHGVLLVADEVITGFGRLGAWFGHQYYGFKPDIVSMAKGLSSGYLPISATAVSREIIATLTEANDDFSHGFTYSGHPTCAAVALRNIEIIEREDLIGRTATITGPRFSKMLADVGRHRFVGDARSIGLMGALEIVADKVTNRRFGGREGLAAPVVRDACIARGLMVRAVRDTIVMSPPLIITEEEIARMGVILKDALDEVAPQLGKLEEMAA